MRGKGKKTHTHLREDGVTIWNSSWRHNNI